MSDTRPLLSRIVNPDMPWYKAVPCNTLAAGALVLLALKPAANLPAALALVIPAEAELARHHR
jgi:hypothetical protein